MAIFSTNQKIISFKETYHTTKYSLRYILKVKDGKLFVFLKALKSILDALFSALMIIFPGLLINKLTSREFDRQMVLILIALLVLPFAVTLQSILWDKKIAKVSQRLNIVISNHYFTKISEMDYENLENPDIQELQERAETTLNSITSAVDMLSTLIYALFSLLAITSIVAVLHPLLIIFICMIIAINSFNTGRTNKKLFDDNKELNKLYLKQSVFPFMLTHIEYAKEIRLYDFSRYLINKLNLSTKQTDKRQLKQLTMRQKLQFLCAVTSFIQQTVIYLYLLFLVIEKSLAIGTMTIYLNATAQFSSALSQLVNAYLNLSNKSLFVEDMIAFFNMPQKSHKGSITNVDLTKDSVIKFENVSFSYPGSERMVLNDINLTIKTGEKLCIVGENGAGKSTFIKLLTRLYEPTDGNITIDGININDIDYKTYQKIFATVFQDFAIFSLSLSENIIMDDDVDNKKLNSVVDQTKLSDLVSKLERGYDTNLDKDIDEHGIQLSGGEGQKMAISRALYHGGEVYILDEPTAALDPNAEYEIYTQFHNMIKDKTAILITHRLSAVQLADKVAVFDDGHIAEYGTHKELYAKGGIYTEMFDKQAQFYRDAP